GANSAYWALDSLGLQRLSMKEGTGLGFPSVTFHTVIDAYSWDANVYAGLVQFHQAKGFDPDSQDVARHLGYPLYRLNSARSVAFPHGECAISSERHLL
ncbi:hypothetical protein DFH09DRAFT_912449, partial [Mycena vulgaris]